MQLLAKWLLASGYWPFAFGHWLLAKIKKTTATQNRKSVNRKLRIANYKLEVRIIRVYLRNSTATRFCGFGHGRLRRQNHFSCLQGEHQRKRYGLVYRAHDQVPRNHATHY